MRLLDGLERSGPLRLLLLGPARAVLLRCTAWSRWPSVALAPAIFARLGPALGAYVAVSLYVPLTGNALEGIGRYAATLFPVFMLLGSDPPHERVHEALLIGGALVLSLLASLFVTFHPMY